MTRALIVGLDGATLDLVQPWAEAGHLPVMADLMSGGRYGVLRSVLPVLSSAAWASFMTGVNPGKHGIYDFVRREQDGYRLRPVHRNHMRGPSLWGLLSRQGRRVGAVNVPMTYPPEPVNGFLVSGLGTPDFRPFTYPESLGSELLARGYQVNKQVAYQPGNEEAFLQEVYRTTRALTESCLWLMGSRPWDVFTVVYRDTDELAHFFWRHMDAGHPAHDPKRDPPYADAILDYYRRLDADLGRLMEAAGPDTSVLVVSDHGGGPLYRDVFLNEWLRQEGYLAVKGESARLRGGQRALAGIGLTRANVSAALRRLRLGRLERWIKDALGPRIEILPRDRRAEFPAAVDWSRTRAYSFGYHGQIYINLAGREPNGIVAPGEGYAEVREAITADLRRLVDPADGEPVVDAVIPGEAVFHGPRTELAPDLVVVMRDFSYITRQGYEFGGQGGQIFAAPVTHESGSHRMEGMLLMSGDGVRAGGEVAAGADLIDVAPTVLHLLGCPVPAEMDGQVLEDWLDTDRPVQTVDIDYDALTAGPEGFTEAEEAEIAARLRDLGYLE